MRENLSEEHRLRERRQNLSEQDREKERHRQRIIRENLTEGDKEKDRVGKRRSRIHQATEQIEDEADDKEIVEDKRTKREQESYILR